MSPRLLATVGDETLRVALAAAQAGADEAMRSFCPGRMARHHTQRQLERWTKPDGSLVTSADVAAERSVRSALERLAPSDPLLGEESGGASEADSVWIVDPIDGTENFSRGNPVWATLLAHQTDGDFDLAVIDAPALDRRWWAVRGGGAFGQHGRDPSLDDARPLRVSPTTDRGDATFAYGGLHECPSERALGRLLATAAGFRCAWGWGNFWGHVLVAEGVVDAALAYEESLWDIAAPALLVEEAGGRWSDVDGETSPAIHSLLTSNGPLHDGLVADLAGTGRP